MHEETLVPGVELLESMRSVGYSFEAAVADIVDNSIAAGATRIDIVADTLEGSYVAFFDDGAGMSPEGARDALKLAGTRHVDRGETDLGRFGLGLKTASLSQCRRLSVATKQDGVITALQWDLDRVLHSGNWSIGVLDNAEIHALPLSERLTFAPHATIVVWQSLDYLLAGATDVSMWLSERVGGLRAHLGLVFQRFLEGSGALTITVNGIAVRPVDPFLSGHKKTQISPAESIYIDGEKVSVEAFTLPHPSDLAQKERQREDLGPRMREFQGFYVYRNRRLISHGGWFGLAKLEEMSKQSRVRVDIPPGLDKHWQLDIKKSRVEPPQSFRQRFKQIIEQVTGKSTRMHRFRGRNATTTDLVFLWHAIEERDGFRYAINVDHPLIAALRAAVPSEQADVLDRTLKDIATFFPARDLYVRIAENKQQLDAGDADEAVLERLRAIRDAGGGAASASELSEALGKVEPFNAVNDLRSIVERIWGEAR